MSFSRSFCSDIPKWKLRLGTAVLPYSSTKAMRTMEGLPAIADLSPSPERSDRARLGLLEMRVKPRGEPIVSRPLISTRVLKVPENLDFHRRLYVPSLLSSTLVIISG